MSFLKFISEAENCMFERVGKKTLFMKKLLLASVALTMFSISIILFQISCKKEVLAQAASFTCAQKPKLQFYGNGILYSFDAVLYSGLWLDFPYIKAYSINPSTSNFRIYADLKLTEKDYISVVHSVSIDLASYTNNIIVGNYPTNNIIPAFRFVLYTGPANLITFASTNYVVNISKIENNLATGTFSGTLLSPVGAPYTITQGTFSNIPVIR